MKKYVFLLLAAAFCAPAFCADDNAEKPKKMTAAEKKAAALEKYDENKDGRLDQAEKNKMKEDIKKEKEEAKKAAREAKKAASGAED